MHIIYYYQKCCLCIIYMHVLYSNKIYLYIYIIKNKNSLFMLKPRRAIFHPFVVMWYRLTINYHLDNSLLLCSKMRKITMNLIFTKTNYCSTQAKEIFLNKLLIGEWIDCFLVDILYLRWSHVLLNIMFRIFVL